MSHERAVVAVYWIARMSNQFPLAVGLFVGAAAALAIKRKSAPVEEKRQSLPKPCSHGHEKLVKHTDEFGKKVCFSCRWEILITPLNRRLLKSLMECTLQLDSVWLTAS
jgi:hypothetical protein